MPDDEQTSTDTAPETDTTDARSEDATTEQSGGGAETGDDTPPEGKPAEEPFDAARAQAKIHKANQEAANLRKRLRELEPLAAKAKQLEDAERTETERLQSRLTEREQEIAQLRQRAVKSEVRALAASSFADPTDPEALLDLSGYVGDDGDIDTDQIKADLADLLNRKPHLGKPKQADPDPERKRRPAPDRTQASGANQPRTRNPADEFAGFVQSRLLKGR
jgi:hypothetical protein